MPRLNTPFPDERLPQHFETCRYMTKARHTVPSDSFKRGLARRAELEKRDGALQDKSYFLRNETPSGWRSADDFDNWGHYHREQWATGKPYNPNLTYNNNILAAYAHTLGWRTVPGIWWACAKVGRPDLAEDYEATIREHIRDADGINRLLGKKPTKAFLLDAGDDLIRPLLADIRHATADVVVELRRYPELHDCLPDPESLLRFGGDD